MNDTLILVTPEGLIKMVNQAACDLLGYRAEELIDQHVGTIFANNDGKDTDDLIKHGDVGNIEKTYLSKDGRKIPVLFSSSVMQDNGGKIQGWVYVGQDITKFKGIEMALYKSKDRYQRLFKEFRLFIDAIDEPVLLLTSELRVLLANQGAEKAFGKETGDLCGKYCSEIWQCSPFYHEDCAVVKSLQTGRIASVQFPDPHGRWWDTNAIPLKGEGGMIDGVIFMARDVTESITIQAESIRNEQLNVLGELAAGVAHEINNPINSIINCAQLLLDKSTQDNKDDTRDMVNIILRESDRITHIVRSLLSFVSDKEDEKGYFRPIDLVSDTLTLAMTQLRKEGINVKIYIAPELPEVSVHPNKIQQVFLNIINNARYALNEKYPDGSHKDKIIEISGGTTMINNRLYTQIIFFDRGTGISQDILGRVMEPFFTTKPRGKGTGLGLSISRKMVKENDGNISIESIKGEFTKIIINLPAKVDL